MGRGFPSGPHGVAIRKDDVDRGAVPDGPAVPAPQEALAAGGEDLVRALDALPEAFRIAVVLRDVQELTYEEIAGVLGIPIGTVMSRIHRGRALLRADLRGRKP